jgi:hypothetical protein
MNNVIKIIGFVTAVVTLVFVVQIRELNAKSDHDSFNKMAQEAKLLVKSFKNDDTQIGGCRSLSESSNSENVTTCIEKTVGSDDNDLALLNKMN